MNLSKLKKNSTQRNTIYWDANSLNLCLI